eukprot:gene19156-24998_t
MNNKKLQQQTKINKKKENADKDHSTISNTITNTFEDEDFYKEPIKRIVRPENQLKLSEEKLNEEITRVLTANDPNIPDNITKYNYKDKSYKQDPEGPMDHLAFHFQISGCSLHKESEEASQQLHNEESKKLDVEKLRKEAVQEALESGEEDIEADAPKTGKNQFNYSERAAQTFNNTLKSRGVATEPPPSVQFFSTVTQWDIYDAYIQDLKKQIIDEELVKQAEKKKVVGIQHDDVSNNNNNSNKMNKENDMVHSQNMSNALKILERMVNQNAEDEIFQDFKYYEDASDNYRNGEGTLTPLWRFLTEKSKKYHVTCLRWNPNYPDLFAVGYGSYDFKLQGPAVGCYDGTVMVFDVRVKGNKPIYTSTIRTGKHMDPVWQVYWQEEDLAKELNFFSISSDGLVASWIMSKNELKMEPVMQLKLLSSSKDDPDDVNLSGLAGGCCFDFNKYNENLFIVGTEEGIIHKCSKAYSGQYLETYHAHHMAVYALKWNPFHPRVFISCSADWTIKIWDHTSSTPILSFDLGNAVSDVAWSPYSSTVFAAVSSDRKVHVFDLAENKHEPLCEQLIVKSKRARLTHVCFNEVNPIIIVGDDRGGVTSLKLSPNLRKVHAPVGEDGEILPHDPIQLQVDKMEKLLQAAST